MAQTTPRLLSGSTNGRGIVIASTNTASGTPIHAALGATGVSAFDEVYLYLQNTVTAVRKIVVCAGGNASGDRIRISLPSASGGLYLVLPGTRYNGGVIIRAYSSSVSKVVSAHGYTNRTQ